VAPANQKAVDTKYKGNQQKIKGKRPKVIDSVFDHPGIVPKDPQYRVRENHHKSKKRKSDAHRKNSAYLAGRYRPVNTARAEILGGHGGNRSAHGHYRHKRKTVELSYRPHARGSGYSAYNIHNGHYEQK